MTTSSSTQLEAARSARPSAAWFAVVGFDGSESSLAALDAASELIRGRDGHLEVVYVAHLPASATLSAPALVGLRENFAAISKELAATVREALDDREPRWHFERRDGSVADELLEAARALRRHSDPDSRIVIVVGSAEHRIHHVVGSTAASLTHEHEFPMLVVPARA